jgi:tetratricopeptide (TPR) repeat protein
VLRKKYSKNIAMMSQVSEADCLLERNEDGTTGTVQSSHDCLLDRNADGVTTTVRVSSILLESTETPSHNSHHETSSFPKLGLKLCHFDDFIAACGGIDLFHDLTTSEVSKKFVKPMTLDAKDSYCNMLYAQNHPAVATATVFISHAWKYIFVDVLKALQFHFESQSDVVIWFDLFSNNQHGNGSRPFDWWCNTFKSAIGEFGHVVMVLAPWSNPIPLTRAWCLFELYCIADMPNGKFEVAMIKSEQAKFLNDVCVDPEGEIGKMLAMIDCEKSETNRPEDREAIFAAVREFVGFQKINQMVFEQLREWMILVTQTAIGKLEQGQDRSSLLAAISVFSGLDCEGERQTLLEFTLAQIYHNQGKYEKAEALYISCLEKRKRMLGEMHISTLKSVNNLGLLYYDQGDNTRAEPLLVSCLESRKKVLGENHPDTLYTWNNLSSVYCNQGKLDLAQELYVSCLEKRTTVLGEYHPDTLCSMNNLGSLYFQLGKYGAAEELFSSCLARRRTISGDNHPETLRCMSNLAFFNTLLGKYDEAQPLHAECLERRMTTLGDVHPDTLISCSNLSFLYCKQGRFEAAEPLYVLCLEKRRLVLGDENPDTLVSWGNLAFVYTVLGKYDKAEELFLSGLKLIRATLGENADYMRSVNNLAVLYYRQGRLDEAEPLFLCALELRKADSGSDHPLTRLAMHNLATLYDQQGKPDLAEPLRQHTASIDHPDLWKVLKL